MAREPATSPGHCLPAQQRTRIGAALACARQRPPSPRNGATRTPARGRFTTNGPGTVPDRVVHLRCSCAAAEWLTRLRAHECRHRPAPLATPAPPAGNGHGCPAAPHEGRRAAPDRDLNAHPAPTGRDGGTSATYPARHPRTRHRPASPTSPTKTRRPALPEPRSGPRHEPSTAAPTGRSTGRHCINLRVLAALGTEDPGAARRRHAQRASELPPADQVCRVCGCRLDPWLVQRGHTTHPRGPL